MVVQLDDIYLLSWESGVPRLGGVDDESNLALIVQKTLRCQNQTTLTCLKRKITLYLSHRKDNLERLEWVCRSLIGVKVRFKDGEEYVSLAQIHKIITLAPKYRYAYAKNHLIFPHLTIIGFKDFCSILEGNNEITFGSLIEIYLTFETMTRIRESLENELQSATLRKLVHFYFFLKNDPYFKCKILNKVSLLSTSDYILFIRELKAENSEWITYESDTKIKGEILAALTDKHNSAIINLKAEYFPIIQNKRRLELKCYGAFTAKDAQILKKNNPELHELTLVRCMPEHGVMNLITSSLKKLTLEECNLTLDDWKTLSQTLSQVDLVLKRMNVYPEVLELLYPRLRSLTIENHVNIPFLTQVPLKALSLTNVIDFDPQPHVRSLELDCLNYFTIYHKVLPLFPFLHTFAYTSPHQTSVTIDQEFFLKLHAAAPQLNKLILNGVKWGSFPPLRTKFTGLIQLDISRTYFFESNPESLLNKLNFIFPNLKRILYSKEDAIHHEPLIATLRDRFPKLKFTEKKSG